jgi:hypothetical protein
VARTSRSVRLGELHPGGFGHVPLALLLDTRARAAELLVYQALSSSLPFDKFSGPVRLRRICERSRRGEKAVRRALRNLENLGYLRICAVRGRPNSFQLLPTPGSGGQGFSMATSPRRIEATHRDGEGSPSPGGQDSSDSDSPQEDEGYVSFSDFMGGVSWPEFMRRRTTPRIEGGDR